jgi:putative Mn2+ efflux pump MntP
MDVNKGVDNIRSVLFAIAEAALLASSLSLDAFTAGFAYGGGGIKVPMLSVQIISIICSGITGLALLAGDVLRPYIPGGLTMYAPFFVLLIIGLSKLTGSASKNADKDGSQSISPAEAALLALSLSLDGIAVGFGAALAQVNSLAVFLWSLVTNSGFLLLGLTAGNKLAGRSSLNLSWLSGAVLILLAISKLF